MKKELQQKLYDDFPSLYQQKDLTIQQSCMPWGFECGDGWYNLIYGLSWAITNLYPSIQASQVKEKFGGLRFYYNIVNNEDYHYPFWRNDYIPLFFRKRFWRIELYITRIFEKICGHFGYHNIDHYIYELIDTAESESYKICEQCGSTDDVKQSEGWIRTECGKCREKRQEVV